MRTLDSFVLPWDPPMAAHSLSRRNEMLMFRGLKKCLIPFDLEDTCLSTCLGSIALWRHRCSKSEHFVSHRIAYDEASERCWKHSWENCIWTLTSKCNRHCVVGSVMDHWKSRKDPILWDFGWVLSLFRTCGRPYWAQVWGFCFEEIWKRLWILAMD